jgi:Predicted membrane-associated Zn-dependent proteases 1
MSVIQAIIGFLVVISILVFFHELGHFSFAKLFRMKVEEFAIGFGPKFRLFSDGETEYTLRAIPLGGFVRIKGMEIEDSVEQRLTGSTGTSDPEEDSAEEAIYDPNDPDGFNNRPIYQRFLVILAGPVFSLLVGWLALSLIGVTFGLPDQQKPLPIVAQVVAGEPADQAGIRPGDTFVTVRGTAVTDWDQVQAAIRSSPGQPLQLSVRSGGDAAGAQVRTVTVTPKAVMDPETKQTIGLIGVAPRSLSERVGLAESFRWGNQQVGLWFQAIGRLVSSGAIKDSVGGPVAIFRETQQATRAGGPYFLALLGQLSLSLGLFNLLPIPVLDGGHLALFSLEAIRRRKLTARQTAVVLNTGLLLLFALLIVVTFKDVSRLFTRG